MAKKMGVTTPRVTTSFPQWNPQAVAEAVINAPTVAQENENERKDNQT